MSKKMLIDATHAEETRVVVVDGNKVEEFDFETLNKRQLAGAELYVRDDLITLVPTFEQLDGGLLARTRESVVLVTVPPGTLRPGTFKVTLVGERTSRTWSLQVH